MKTEKIEVTKHITITNGKVSDYIFRDENFKPCLYYKHTHRNRAIQAVAHYLAANEFFALSKLSNYITFEEQEKISLKIMERYLEKATDFVYDYSNKINDAYFTYLPKNN